MIKTRLDQEVVNRGLVASRSQAESYIKLGKVKLNGSVAAKPSMAVSKDDKVQMVGYEQYVSRAGLKLASVAEILNLNFRDKIVLDVGSSTGGFTDYSLKHGAKKVIAVDVGTDQMHPSLLGDPRIELHEKTDIRQVCLRQTATSNKQLGISIEVPEVVLIDVSFISLRDILPHISKLITHNSIVAAMVKPQFEVYAEQKHPSTSSGQAPSTGSGFRTFRTSSKVLNKGIIKNERMRRDILKDFENWVQNKFVVLNKADSEVSGAKGNTERFYLLKINK